MSAAISGASAQNAQNEGLAGLHPAYFALVMATGILSIASHLISIPLVATVVFALNLVIYPLPLALMLLRAIRHREEFIADFSHHGRAVGFFTTVAATCVLGSQCRVIGGAPEPGFWLW